MSLDWDDFRYVLALRREGSLGAAARSMKVEQSTASRRLAALEAALETPLVTRSTDGISLTEAGMMAADVAETMETAVIDLERQISGEDRRAEGVVRVATTEGMTSFVMAGLIPLRQEYPAIQVELVIGNQPQDLMRREADLALRMFREQNPVLVTRKIGDVGWSLYGTSAHAPIESLEGCCLRGRPVIAFGESLAKSAAMTWLAAHSRPEDIALSCTSVNGVMSAARSGIGIALLPCFMARNEPALVRLTRETIVSVEAFLVIPPDHRDTVRVRLVMDAIAKLFADNRGILDGSA